MMGVREESEGLVYQPLGGQNLRGDEAVTVYDSPTQRLVTWFRSTGVEASSHCHTLRRVSWTRSEVLCS